MTNPDRTAPDEPRGQSQTQVVLDELQLYGWRPLADDPDPRPLPDGDDLAGMVVEVFDVIVGSFSDTRLEPDLEPLLWSVVSVFHRAAGRISRELDDNEQRQRRLQQSQDGSEVKACELERLIAEGITLIERRDAFELIRDLAAERFEHATGSAWRPRSGSLVNHRTLTAALIDSRDFIAAKRRTENEPLLPPGPKIAFSGGLEFTDHILVWSRLDQVLTRHPDMVLIHGGAPRGAELFASRWADRRKIPQIACRPDWARHGKAAPFRRNDAILDLLPIGVLVFAGNGIQANFRDKARRLGIPVLTVGAPGG